MTADRPEEVRVGLEMIDSASNIDSVVDEGTSRWSGWLLVLGAGLVVFWLLSLGGGSSDSGSDSAGQPPPGEPASSMPTTRPPPTSPTLTTLASADDAGPTGSTGDGPAQSPAGPLLGRPTGLDLIIDDGALTTIDLDAGTERRHRRSGRILGAVGTTLVLDPTDGPVTLVDVGDIDGPAVETGVEVAFGVGSSSLPGHFWLVSGPNDTRSTDASPTLAYDLIDAGTGVAVNHLDVEFDGSVPVLASPEVASPPNGGVYVLDDPRSTRFRLVTDGRLLARVGPLALVRTCASPLSCERYWFDLERETVIDQVPVPPHNVSLLLFPAVVEDLLFVAQPAGITLWSAEDGTIPGVILNSDLFVQGGVSALEDVVAFGRSSVTLLDRRSGDQIVLSTPDFDSMVLVDRPAPPD